jgi:hypothetical protein
MTRRASTASTDRSAAVRAVWARLTPEARAERIEAMRARRWDPPAAHVRASQVLRRRWAEMTPAQRAAEKRRLAEVSAARGEDVRDRLVDAGRQQWNRMTPAEREAKVEAMQRPRRKSQHGGTA